MIRINLLPEEYRRRARTPIRLLAAVMAVVAVNASLGAYWFWLAFGVAAEVDTQMSVLELEMQGLRPQVAYHEALDAETKVHASRESTLAQITQSRVLWTRKLDELIDVVSAGRDGIRHFVWFDDLQVKTGTGGARSTDFGSLKANGHSGSAEWNQVAYFLDDVEDRRLTSFSDMFTRPATPPATKDPIDEEYIPSETWSFPLNVALLSTEERQKAKAALEEMAQ